MFEWQQLAVRTHWPHLAGVGGEGITHRRWRGDQQFVGLYIGTIQLGTGSTGGNGVVDGMRARAASQSWTSLVMRWR